MTVGERHRWPRARDVSRDRILLIAARAGTACGGGVSHGGMRAWRRNGRCVYLTDPSPPWTAASTSVSPSPMSGRPGM